MTIKLALGFLPYIEIVKPLKRNVLGSSKYFIVWLQPDYSKETEAHEVFHVEWWYAVSILFTLALLPFVHPLIAVAIGVSVDPLLGTIMEPYKRLEESFAYAKAASMMERPQAYIDAIGHPDSIQSQRYGKDFYTLVRKRLKHFQ